MKNSYSFNVSGTTFRQDNVKKAFELYCESDSLNINIIPEPENKFDKNALAVFCDFNDEKLHVGYVPKEINQDLLNCIDGGIIKKFYLDKFFLVKQNQTYGLTIGFLAENLEEN